MNASSVLRLTYLKTGIPNMLGTLEKEQAHRLVDALPSQATWEDLAHAIYVRQSIDRGLRDIAEDRVRSVCEVRAKYGLPE